MFRYYTASSIISRGTKKLTDIKWVRPEKVPRYKPEKSGDLEGLPNLPRYSIAEDYSLSEEIKNAPESVKKIFSVEHLGKKEYNKLVKKEFIDRVRRYKYDENTAETRIARMTGHIRCLQDTVEKFPRNEQAIQTVQIIIDKRKKYLKYMRQYDYKKFEWLLEKLNIEYKAHPDCVETLTRKQSLRKLTEMYCDELRRNKLAEYRNLLESQQGPFLKEKLETFKFIRSEQEALNVPITVTEQDIKKIANQLEEWTVKDELKKNQLKKKRDLLAD